MDSYFDQVVKYYREMSLPYNFTTMKWEDLSDELKRQFHRLYPYKIFTASDEVVVDHKPAKPRLMF